MAELHSLIPNPTPAELALELTDANRFSKLDPDFVRRQKDALLCEPSILPFLAWERSVDLWYDDWPVEKKRVVADRWADYEKLKGTIGGREKFLELVGSRLVSVIRPPDKTFFGKNYTADERRAFVQRFPQLRIYPFVQNEVGQYRTFTSAASGSTSGATSARSSSDWAGFSMRTFSARAMPASRRCSKARSRSASSWRCWW